MSKKIVMGKKMDERNMKITGGGLSIALLLITGRAKTTRLSINPASILIGMGWFFQLILKGINNQLSYVAGFSSNKNTAAVLLLAGDAIIGASPVRANLTGNIITGTGNRLNSNFPLSTNISTNSRQPDVSVISVISGIFDVVSPDFSMSQPGVIKHVCIANHLLDEPPGVAMSGQQVKNNNLGS